MNVFVTKVGIHLVPLLLGYQTQEIIGNEVEVKIGALDALLDIACN